MDRTTAKALAPAPLEEREVRSIILGIMLAMLLAALEQTIVATALPTIGRDLGDLDLLPWVATAYLLTATAATPLYGKLADIRGRRLALLNAIARCLPPALSLARSRPPCSSWSRRAPCRALAAAG